MSILTAVAFGNVTKRDEPIPTHNIYVSLFADIEPCSKMFKQTLNAWENGDLTPVRPLNSLHYSQPSFSLMRTTLWNTVKTEQFQSSVIFTRGPN